MVSWRIGGKAHDSLSSQRIQGNKSAFQLAIWVFLDIAPGIGSKPASREIEKVVDGVLELAFLTGSYAHERYIEPQIQKLYQTQRMSMITLKEFLLQVLSWHPFYWWLCQY